jgi:ABC-type cobalamin transport system ATPase subunit
MNDKKSLSVTVRATSGLAPKASSITIGGKNVDRVSSGTLARKREHVLPPGAVTGWTYCTFHDCSCVLPKACYLPDDHCDILKVCMHVAHTCTRPKVCTNPVCRCDVAKILDEHHGVSL